MSTAAGHLTVRRIAELEPRNGARYIVWDGGIPGFGVRVSGGAKTFILKYRVAGGRAARARWPLLDASEGSPSSTPGTARANTSASSPPATIRCDGRTWRATRRPWGSSPIGS
jgi:hypothetical protein